MAIERVREYLRRYDADDRIIELEESSATVELAARALGVEPARIAKTLAFRTKDGPILIVAAGDVRMDNKAFKRTFGEKMQMLPRELTEDSIGHAAGGVCPFGVREGVRIYLDRSLQRFETVFPACGSSNSAIELTNEELERFTGPVCWVDLAKAADVPKEGA